MEQSLNRYDTLNVTPLNLLHFILPTAFFLSIKSDVFIGSFVPLELNHPPSQWTATESEVVCYEGGQV